jgi:hypothetical protein
MNSTALKGYLGIFAGVLVETIRDMVNQPPGSDGHIAIPTSGWGFLAIVLIGLGSRLLHRARPPGELAPTPNLEVEDDGAELGKASGEAGAAAARGPFTRRSGASAAAPSAAPGSAPSDK